MATAFLIYLAGFVVALFVSLFRCRYMGYEPDGPVIVACLLVSTWWPLVALVWIKWYATKAVRAVLP